MSGGPTCQCSEATEPLTVATGSNRPARLWRVLQRYCSHSAFSGYHCTPSDWSSVQCLRCGAAWRTKANYVAVLPDRAADELNITSGHAGHAAAMAARGRTRHENDGGSP